MPTVKLVVIGASGVGKTSLRGKYVSGRFSNGYRATIGADFITKVLDHPTREDGEAVTLQIWDTAGQERFSSLSTAFFRGADAALLMFDVTSPSTLPALSRWWQEFCEQAPVKEEEMRRFCVAVIGNKVDLVPETLRGGEGRVVGEEEASEFLSELVPLGDEERPMSPFEVLPTALEADELEGLASASTITQKSPKNQKHKSLPLPPLSNPQLSPNGNGNGHAIAFPSISPTAAIQVPNGTTNTRIRHSSSPLSSRSPNLRGQGPGHHPKSRSRSSTRFNSVTTMQSGFSVYHTPTSSISGTSGSVSVSGYESARSSPEPWVSSGRSSPTTTKRTPSTSTLTPSLFASTSRGRTVSNSNDDSEMSPLSPRLPPHQQSAEPEKGPKLFFTSAKTGEGVGDVFEYVARRVVLGAEWEERRGRGSGDVRYGEGEGEGGDVVRLGLDRRNGLGKGGTCC